MRRRPARPDEADRLALPSGAQVYHLTRVRLLSGHPVMIERGVYPDRVGVLVAGMDLATDSITERLEELGVVFADAEHVIDAVPATAEDARLLEVRPRVPMLRERRLTTDLTGTPVEWSDDRYLGRAVAFSVRNSTAVNALSRTPARWPAASACLVDHALLPGVPASGSGTGTGAGWRAGALYRPRLRAGPGPVPVPAPGSRGNLIRPGRRARHPHPAAASTAEPARWSIEPVAAGSMEHRTGYDPARTRPSLRRPGRPGRMRPAGPGQPGKPGQPGGSRGQPGALPGEAESRSRSGSVIPVS